MKKSVWQQACRRFVLPFWCIALSLGSVAEAGPQESGTRIGIAASLQDDQRDIMIPIWTERVVVAPALTFVSISDAAIDFGLGVFIRVNFRTGTAVPYAGFRAGVLVLDPEGGNSITDFVIGPAFGGEYFLSDHFSVGVEGQLNVAISDEYSYRFGNPDGTNVNTASSVMATFYF